MGTKWRNRSISLLLIVCALGAWTLTLFAASDLYKHRGFAGSYFGSDLFGGEMNVLLSMIVIHHVDAEGFEAKSLQEQVGEDFYARLKKVYAGRDQAFTNRLNAEIKEKRQTFENAKRYLDNRANAVQYVLRNKDTCETYSNMGVVPKDWPDKTTGAILHRVEVPLPDAPSGSPFRPPAPLSAAVPAPDGVRLEGDIVILKDVPGPNAIQAEYEAYSSVQSRFWSDLYLFGALLAAAAALTYVASRLRAEAAGLTAGARAAFRRALPLDARALLTGAAFLLLLAFLSLRNEGPYDVRPPIRSDRLPELIIGGLLAGCLFAGIRGAFRLLRDPETLAAEWRQSIVMLIRSALERKGLYFKLLVFAGLAALIGLLPVIVLAAGGAEGVIAFSLLYSAGFILFALPYMLRKLGHLKAIVQGAEAQAAGDFSAVIPEKGRGQLSRLAASMNRMKTGLQISLEKQLVNDRLKTELITNVSHDLKTPLTSIINYVDLLKRDDLSREQIAQYVDVLDRKTERLKILIDDLFEASKMASGAAELQLGQADVAALLSQALGEFGDRIEASGLAFRVHIEKTPLFAVLDGRKTWRLFENLISNILKYALPGTRVYVTAAEKEDGVVVALQNISACEPAFAAEELFERFKRGDPSRHTEGSGLGLAIAKSIAELQGGKLDIEIDGDQFKAIVTFRRG